MNTAEKKLSASDKQLLHAAAMGDTGKLQQALQLGANPNSQDQDNNTPLHLACMQSNNACTHALLTIKNIELSHTNNEGYTPLRCAIEYGEEENALLLLNHTQTITLPQNALHRACYWGQARVVHALCKLPGLSVEQTDTHGHTPHYYATKYGHADCLQILLDTASAPPSQPSLIGTAITHLQTACANLLVQRGLAEQCPEIEKAILTQDTGSLKAASNHLKSYRCKDNLPALHLAAALNKTSALELLINISGENVNMPDESGNTALHYAAMQGNEACIARLLQHPHINPNALNTDHCTPLRMACWQGYSRSVHALLQHPKTDANEPDADAWSPLCWAAYWGHDACLAHLLQQGNNMNVNHANTRGETALHMAAAKGHTKCLQLLLCAPGINKQLKDEHGNTPMKRAKQKGHAACATLLKAAK